MKENLTIRLLLSFAFFYFFAVSFNLCAQSLSVSSGFGHTSFFDLKKNSNHQFANYSGGSHQFLKLEIDSYLPKTEFLSIHLKLERSSGTIESQSVGFFFCGIGPPPSSRTPNVNSNITLYRMSLGFMPINIKIYKDIRFKIGGEVSRIFDTKMTDINNDFNDPIDFFPLLSPDDEDVIRDLGAGLIFEFQFGNYKLGEDLLIVPIYNSSVTLFDEVKTGMTTRTFRQSVGIAVKWNLKPRI